MKKTFTPYILPTLFKMDACSLLRSMAMVLLIAMFFSVESYAQISIPNTTAVTENFDGMVFSGAGTNGASTASLPANWKMSPAGGGATATWANVANVTTVTQQYGSGSPAAGGRYVLANSVTTTDKAVGILTSAGYGSTNCIMGWFRNTNTSNLISLTIAYDLERYRIFSANASDTFFYSTNGTSWTGVPAGNIGAASLPTNASSAWDFNPSGTPSTSNAGKISLSGISITGLNIPTNGNIYLRWNLNTTGTNSQLIAIDNISVVAGFATPAIVLSDNTLSGFTYMVGMGPSAVQSYTVSGANLAPASGNITITAPASGNYEISSTNSPFTPATGSPASYTIAYSGGSLSATTVYVRLKAGLAINTYNGETVACSGGGAATETVTCNGSVTNFFNSLSDVIPIAGTEPATIPSFQNAPPPLTIATGSQVWRFTIRDGGGSADADNLPTIVNSISLVGLAGDGNSVSNWSQAIRTVSLFDISTNALLATGTVSASQIDFTGMSFTVPDNTSRDVSVRLSLNCGFGGSNSDGDDFVFRLSSANFTTAGSSTSSQKAAFAAAVSTNGRNVLDVVATKLLFTQQPQSNVSINNNFSPAVTVTATDACGNVDKGFVGTINITSSGTLLSSPQSAAASAGIASFSGISHTAAGGPFNLTASSTGLTSAVSNPFNVTLSTTLGSGDLMFVGFDSYVGSAADLYSIANFVPILPTTSFIIGNIVYDVKAPSNVKQDRWYNGNGNLTNDLAILKFTYNGASNIAAGSIICISVDGGGLVTAITVNGVNVFSQFTAENINGQDSKNPGGAFLSNVNLAASNPDAVFLMQGTFSAQLSDGTHNYRTFTGSVFGGIQTYGTFKAFSAAAETVSPGNRISKVHPSIECIGISTGGTPSATGYYAYYNAGAIHTGSHRNLIKAIAAYSGSNWTKGVNNGGDDIAVNNTCTNTFTVTSNVSPGLWGGDVSTDWFDCNNWDDFNVPTSNTDVLITNSAVNNAQISSLSSKAPQFNYTGDAKSLNIIGKQLIIQNTGPIVNTLNVTGSLTINTINGLDMNDGVAGTVDGTINLTGSWTNNFSNGFDAGESLINFNGPSGQGLTALDGETFYNFTNSNTGGGVVLANTNTNITVNNVFSLTNGILTINQNTLTLNGTATGSGTITGSANSNLVIGGTAGGALGTLNFTAGSRLLNNITMNRTGAAASATLGTDLSINTLATITSGILNAGTNSFSGTGGLTMTGGELQVARAGVTSPELSGTYTLSAGAVNFTGTGSQTVRAINYYDLTFTSSGPRVMANSGTIGVANSLNKLGTNTYTFTGSTVDYNGTNALGQNITPFTALATPGSTYNNLTLSNSLNTVTSKTLTAATDVEGDLTLNNSIVLKLGANYLNLKSTATKTARVAPVSNTASIDYSSGGRFVVERYYPGRRKWRMITAPVTVDATNSIFNSWQMGGASPIGSGTYVTGPSPTGASGNGLDVSPLNNPSLKVYNTNTNVWDPVTNTISTRISGINGGAGLPDNIGYFMFVRGDRTPANTNAFNPFGAVLETTLRDTGKIQVQDYDFNGNPTVGQFAVVGNPYASPVDFTLLSRSSGMANKFYAWDPNINGTSGVGGYVIHDFAAGTVTTVPTGQSGVSQTKIIQSSQAIVVETQAGAAPKITFNEAAKSNLNNLNLFRPVPNPLSSVAVNLHATTADGEFVLADGVMAQFRNDFSDGLDQLDGQKFGNINETFSIQHGTNSYMLERRKPVKAGDTIFLSLRKARLLPYRFNIMLNNMDDKRLAAYLVDNYLNKKTPVNIEGSTWVDFTVSNTASAAPNRFYILFKKAFRFNHIHANVVKKDVAVQWGIEAETEMNRYEVERSIDGEVFETIGTVNATDEKSGILEYSLLDMQPAPGIYYYRIKGISQYGSIDYSDAVKVKVVRASSGMYVYPNPVRGGKINIQMGALPAGIYTIRILSNAGQAMLQKQITHNAGTVTESIAYTESITAGTYQLEVTGSDGKKHSITVMVSK